MSDMEAHPVADLFPMLADEELAELAADIAERGLLQPIVLDADGRILDGRNRIAACEMAGVAATFTTYSGNDPDGYALAVNGQRREMTKRQKAIVGARMILMSNLDNKDQEVAAALGVSRSSLVEAVIVSRYPELADAVLARVAPMPFSAALDEARTRDRRKAEDEKAKARLRGDAPDLLALVEEERMSLDEAASLLDARIEKENALRNEQLQKERLAYQQALNAYNNAVDGLTAALSYAQAYTPPKEIPDNYLSVSAFKRRTAKLIDLINEWSSE